jgi:hypothetical protein
MYLIAISTLKVIFLHFVARSFCVKIKLAKEMPKLPKLPKMPKVEVFYRFYLKKKGRYTIILIY